jgi:hypothetical protein
LARLVKVLAASTTAAATLAVAAEFEDALVLVLAEFELDDRAC